jgi:hypothetical protein
MKAKLRAVGLNELLGGACDGHKLLCEQRPHPFDNLTRSQIPKARCVKDFSLVDIDAELANSAFDSFHLGVRFFPQLCCHTGSHHLFDGSNRAVMDFYFSHDFAPPKSKSYWLSPSLLNNTGTRLRMLQPHNARINRARRTSKSIQVLDESNAISRSG